MYTIPPSDTALSSADLHLIRYFEQGPVTHCPFTTVTSAFYHHVASSLDTVAVRDMSGSVPRELSYHDLASRVQSLAAQLRELGVGPAEAAIVIANEKITKKIVYGLRTRGIPAYGAIGDS